MTPDSLKEHLESKGYLTVNQLVGYLKAFHPEKSVSYPALMRYAHKGYLEYEKFGGQYRVTKASIEHFVQHGTTPVDTDQVQPQAPAPEEVST